MCVFVSSVFLFRACSSLAPSVYSPPPPPPPHTRTQHTNTLVFQICNKWALHPADKAHAAQHTSECTERHQRLAARRSAARLECCVCLEVVLSKTNPRDRKFGLLSGCDHVFCLSCIRNWRSNAEDEKLDTTGVCGVWGVGLGVYLLLFCFFYLVLLLLLLLNSVCAHHQHITPPTHHTTNTSHHQHTHTLQHTGCACMSHLSLPLLLCHTLHLMANQCRGKVNHNKCLQGSFGNH